MPTLNGQQLQPPAQTYDLGGGDKTTDYNYFLKSKGADQAANPSGQVSVPGVGQMNYQDSLKYGVSSPTNQNAPQQQPMQQTMQQTTPQIGEPNTQSPQPLQQPNQSTAINGVPSEPDLSQKYGSGLNQLNQSSQQAPDSGGQARSAVSTAVGQYQPPQQQYQPTPQFMQMGDPIMKQFVNAAMVYQNESIQTGYTAKAMQANFANQVQNIDLQAANIQNIMNGTRDDIRSEIGKAGGFATESQVEGLVTTRNRDLLKQYNNIELQKQTMQSQMQLQVGLAQADHQFAVDKFDNLTKTATLYKGIYDNATDQVDKLVQNVGYSGLAAAYNNDPYALSLAEQHLNMPQGTLSDPQSLQSLETYRQQSLTMGLARLGMQQARTNIYIGNNTANQGALNGQLESYKTTGVIPPFKSAAQSNAFWNAAGQDQSLIGDAQANKNLRSAASNALKTQTTQYEATKTAIGTVDKQLNLLDSYLNKVDRSGTPVINKYKNWLAGTYTGDPDVTALNNIIQTTSKEYAKILGGGAASIAGTPVSTQKDAEGLLNSSMTNGQLKSVISALRVEGNNRLSSQKETIDSINSNLKNIGRSSGTTGGTTLLTGPDGKKYNVPMDQVDAFKKAGGY